MLHECSKIEVLEEVSFICIKRFCDLCSLIRFHRQLLYLVHEKLVGAASSIILPRRARKNLRSIALNQPPKVLCEDFHAVGIDKLSEVSKADMTKYPNSTHLPDLIRLNLPL